jgi:protein TonB
MSKPLPALHVPSLLAAALALALAACENGGGPATAGIPADAAAQVEAAPGRLADLDTERLLALASQAIAGQRVHAPAGDNAVEYYLALREKAPQDAAISTALVEFQPYVLIAAEQALSRSQPDEADRLLALLGRIDAQAPALPRLRESVARLRTSLAAQEAADREAALAKQAAGTQRAEIAKDAASVERLAKLSAAAAAPEAPVTPPVMREAMPPRAEPATPAVVAASAPATPAPAAPLRASERALPRLLEDEAPRYPLAAVNRKLEGQVEVAFTILPDGRVANARVVSAEPAGVFDRAALTAASRWRFESTGATASTSRTLTFRLPKG